MATPQFILVINDPRSAILVLQTVTKFARVFTKHPIRVLRADSEQDRQQIINLRISAAPALLFAGKTLIGSMKICAFLEQFVHSGSAPAEPQITAEESVQKHFAATIGSPDDERPDEDEPLGKDEMLAKMARYKKAMDDRGAKVLATDENNAPTKPAKAAAAKAAKSPAKPPPRSPITAQAFMPERADDDGSCMTMLDKYNKNMLGVPSSTKPMKIPAQSLMLSHADDSSDLLDNYNKNILGVSTSTKPMRMPSVHQTPVDSDESKFVARFNEGFEETRMTKKTY